MRSRHTLLWVIYAFATPRRAHALCSAEQAAKARWTGKYPERYGRIATGVRSDISPFVYRRAALNGQRYCALKVHVDRLLTGHRASRQLLAS